MSSLKMIKNIEYLKINILFLPLSQNRGDAVCRVPRQCPAAVAELIDACQEREPANRPTAPEVLDRLLSLQLAGELCNPMA